VRPARSARRHIRRDARPDATAGPARPGLVVAAVVREVTDTRPVV
jgi:hypoxanthine phosphoribosyltransferase